MADGLKYDSGKPRWSLLPFAALLAVVQVLEFGATKYKPNSWQGLENGRERYFDAAIRHLVAWHGGEIIDAESGLHHLAHAACNLLFLLWFDVTGALGVGNGLRGDCE
jgi:hypothetical protein